MNFHSKFTIRKKRSQVPTSERKPVQTEDESQSLATLYSYKDFLIDLLRHYTMKQKLFHPHLPTLIVEFVPIYNWSNSQIRREESDQRDEKANEEAMTVDLSHCSTIASNGYHKFGAVLGSKLDPRLDHVINVQLVEGIEFGVGICDESQLKMTTRRDFMCIQGGYGYYNYKTKSAHTKPKYPPGLYYQVQTCRKVREEADILFPGDVLTLVIQRENVNSPGGGIGLRSKFGSDRDLVFNPMGNLKASSTYILSFYKNGEDMNYHVRNLEGPFYLCLNYYFVGSKIRLLSDYNFRKIYQQRARLLRKNQETPRMTNTSLGAPMPGPRRYSRVSFPLHWKRSC